jgi:ketosteroid isomerase-like protein
MSQENVEAFRRAVDAGNRRDVEALIEELDPEVEWHPTLAVLVGGEATVYRGREGARAAIRGLLEAFAEIHLEFPEIRDLDDRLVAIGRMRARGTESGAEAESPWAYLVQFKNGRPTSIRGYLDPKEALEAAGLRESAISQENVEAFRRAVEANNRQDVEAPLEELDPRSSGIRGCQRCSEERRRWVGDTRAPASWLEMSTRLSPCSTLRSRRSGTSTIGSSRSATCVRVAGKARPRPSRPGTTLSSLRTARRF